MADLELLKNPDGTYPRDIASMLTSADPEKKEMLTTIGTMVIEHSQYHDAMDWLEDCFNESESGLEATSGLFYGKSGVGKSTILRRFTTQYGGPFTTVDGDKRPVIRVSTPANPTLANTFKAMVRALGPTEALTNDVDDLRSIVLTQLAGQNVKMIIFDEFTHIVEDRSEKFATRAVRGLKELLSENQCQCVFAGTDQLVSVHGIYGQFRRRSAGDFCLHAFDWDNEDDRDEWIQMMELIQSELPIKCAHPLGQQKMARTMHMATDGILDHVMKLLFRATSFAYDDEETCISNQTLSAAFERLRRGYVARANPFGEPANRRRGIRITKDEPVDEETSLHSTKNPNPSFRK
tara:strand:+ start:2963 stop:4012 length:1050 start_codon:yes stop_codon:yes gene_type:complete